MPPSSSSPSTSRGGRLSNAVSRPKKPHRCPLYHHVAAQIRKTRRSLGMTQEDVAGAMGIHRWGYQKIETGRQRISLEQILWFAQFFKVHYLSLLEGYVPPRTTQYRNVTGPKFDVSDVVMMGADPMAPGAPDTTPRDDTPSLLEIDPQSFSASGGASWRRS